MKTPEHKELDVDKYGSVGAVFIAQDILERAELVAEHFWNRATLSQPSASREQYS